MAEIICPGLLVPQRVTKVTSYLHLSPGDIPTCTQHQTLHQTGSVQLTVQADSTLVAPLIPCLLGLEAKLCSSHIITFNPHRNPL